MIIRSSALSFAVCAAFLTQSALAAVPPKPAAPAKAAKSAPVKPVAAKAAAAKPVATKPAPAKPVAAKAAAKASPKAAAPQTVYRLPAGGAPTKVPATSNEPPPGVRVDPVPVTASAPAAAPKKAAAKKPAKKKQVASKKSKKMNVGRAALTPMDRIDQGQLATDHLAGAESKSTLDLLVSYKETLREGDFETAGVLMRLVVNETPRHEVVTAVNDLIGMPLDTQDTEVLMELARADRADAVAGATARQAEGEQIGSPLGARIHAAHAAVGAAPRTSRLDALAAYKHAVLEGNAEAAAVALSGVVQGPLDEKAVTTANALLGVENIITPGQLAAVN
jgi:hypothetical protein